MANLKDIKRRIASVKNTQQITRAMKMVSAAKMRRAQSALLEARPYADKLVEMLYRIGEVTDLSEHALLEQRTGQKTLYIVVAADRGLCGGYNSHICRYAQTLLDADASGSVITVGSKARDFFVKRGYNVIGEYVDIGDYVSYDTAKEIADAVVAYFLNGIVDAVKVVYAHFINTVMRQQEVINLLPVAPEASGSGVKVAYIFDPSPMEVLDVLLPRYIATTLHRAMLEGKASEQGARMAAMDAATKNADEMIKKLTIKYNRARQAAITTEISEIVGGAEALK